MTQLTLPDGRTLDYLLTGPEGGPLLAFHHGTPGSAHQFSLVSAAAAERGLRLLTWSRPGYAASSRQPGRAVAAVVADLEALLDAAGVEECLTAGWSGGGPHALASVIGLPERVRGASVIAGVGPYDAEGLDFLAGMGQDNLDEFGAALEGEAPLRTLLDAVRGELQHVTADQVVDSMASLLPPEDVAVITGGFAEDLAASFRESVSAGVDGWLDDDLAFAAPWGFDLVDVDRPVSLWQGSEDLMVPFAHGQWLAARMPWATAHLEQGEGHISITVGSIGRILDELLAPTV